MFATLGVVAALALTVFGIYKACQPGLPGYGDCYKHKDERYTYARVTSAYKYIDEVTYDIAEGYFIYGEAKFTERRTRTVDSFNNMYEKVDSCAEFNKFEGKAEAARLREKLREAYDALWEAKK